MEVMFAIFDTLPNQVLGVHSIGLDEGIFSKLWHCAKSSICICKQLNKLFGNFRIMQFLRHNHLRLFKFRPWMQFSIIVGEASVRSSNLRLRNPFELIWNNVGNLTQFFNEMPSKFFVTYHMKWKQKDYQYKKTFHPNVKFIRKTHIYKTKIQI